LDQNHRQTDRDRDSAAGSEFIHVFVNAYGQSDIGKDRSSNEDQFLIAVLNRQLEVFQTSLGDGSGHDLDEPAEHGWVFLVAEGIGGHVSGDEASALTAKASLSYLRSTMPWFATLGPDQLERAEKALKTVVHRIDGEAPAADHRPAATGKIRSALTLAYLLWPHLFVVHTGDSRCYLLRDGRMRQLTTGRPQERERPDRNRSDRNDLTGVGTAEHHPSLLVGSGRRLAPEPIVDRWALQDRDGLLLCSDGLTRSLSDDEIEEIMAKKTFANARCQALIEAANAAGGTDNKTVVIASFEDFGARSDAS
jgi:serine/threonine protein phosphatase PrpC